jgi:uracil phosphoribosyltransferase
VCPFCFIYENPFQAVDLVAGARAIGLICLVAAPEGVDVVATVHPDVPIHTASLDDYLEENKYIVACLGDAGDRIFVTA